MGSTQPEFQKGHNEATTGRHTRINNTRIEHDCMCSIVWTAIPIRELRTGPETGGDMDFQRVLVASERDCND